MGSARQERYPERERRSRALTEHFESEYRISNKKHPMMKCWSSCASLPRDCQPRSTSADHLHLPVASPFTLRPSAVSCSILDIRFSWFLARYWMFAFRGFLLGIGCSLFIRFDAYESDKTGSTLPHGPHCPHQKRRQSRPANPGKPARMRLLCPQPASFGAGHGGGGV